MKKKFLMIILLVTQLVVTAEVVMAAITKPNRMIHVLPGMTIDVACEGGDIEAVVDNSSHTGVAHLTCYNAFSSR